MECNGEGRSKLLGEGEHQEVGQGPARLEAELHCYLQHNTVQVRSGSSAGFTQGLEQTLQRDDSARGQSCATQQRQSDPFFLRLFATVFFFCSRCFFRSRGGCRAVRYVSAPDPLQSKRLAGLTRTVRFVARSFDTLLYSKQKQRERFDSSDLFLARPALRPLRPGQASVCLYGDGRDSASPSPLVAS